MILKQDHVDYLKQIISVAKTINIEELVITEDYISGLNSQHTALIYQPNGMGFPPMGLIRLDILSSRLNIMETRSDFNIHLEMSPNDPNLVRALKFKSKGANVSFTTANPKQITAPKTVKDEMLYAFELSKEDVKLISNAASVMPANADDKENTIRFIGSSDGVRFEITDKSNDNFHGNLDTVAININGDNTPIDFCLNYPLKTMLNVINAQSGLIRIGKKGMINAVINDMCVYVLPRAV